MRLFDLNCDMGEGVGNEAELMPFITSANIACTFHAGDIDTMKRVVALCVKHDVAIGAHPSYPDRKNFGRLDIIGKTIRPDDLLAIVSVQLLILQKVVKEQGAELHHVKAHGALYNRAAWDKEVAGFLCQAIADAAPNLLVYGLSGSSMQSVAENFGLRFFHEVFADRTYQDDGSLTPRTVPNALIENDDKAIRQVTEMVQYKRVRTVSGNTIPIKAETICLHGDGAHAVTFARKLHHHLTQSFHSKS